MSLDPQLNREQAKVEDYEAFLLLAIEGIQESPKKDKPSQLPFKELTTLTQEEVASLMESIYFALKDCPSISEEVTLSRQMVNKHNLMTIGLLKHVVLASSTILETYIPLIEAAKCRKPIKIRDFLEQLLVQVKKLGEEVREEANTIRNCCQRLEEKIKKVNKFLQEDEQMKERLLAPSRLLDDIIKVPDWLEKIHLYLKEIISFYEELDASITILNKKAGVSDVWM